MRDLTTMTERIGALQTYPDDEWMPADPQARSDCRYWTSAEIASDYWFLVEFHGDPSARERPVRQMWVTVCAETAVKLTQRPDQGPASLMACLPAPRDGQTERIFLFGEVEEILADQTSDRQVVRLRDGRAFWVERQDDSGVRHSTQLSRLYVAPPDNPASMVSAP